VRIAMANGELKVEERRGGRIQMEIIELFKNFEIFIVESPG